MPGDLHSKDAVNHVRGKWVIEFAELGQIRRNTIETLKAFISRTVERFRPAYGRNEIVYPRQCIFVGTTNKETYLPDETGNRRIWPVRVGQVDLESLRRDRDQLWAEAVARYKAGETWWLTDKVAAAVAKAEQADRYESDPWTEKVLTYVENLSEVTIPSILDNALYIVPSRQERPAQGRVADILREDGWEPKRSGRRRSWVRKSNDTE